MIKDAAYWIALAHLPRWSVLKINNIIIKFYHENKISISDFFNLPDIELAESYGFNSSELNNFQQAKKELPNYAFLAESLYNQGYELIPIISSEYPKTLKNNLKTAHSPALIYIKGNKQILNEKSIAIVGSRDASDTALKFADNIAKLASKEYKVIVSGFAKGVDKQALESAISYSGQSIIVLPQGILTFSGGFKNYYKHIVNGDILVLSSFFPKAPWQAEFAMARNPIIYGLANEIYVAESFDKGGTWAGVIDGIRKGRIIYIRKPESTEKNANNLLIQKGAMPVDFDGNKIIDYNPQIEIQTAVTELKTSEKQIIDILTNGEFSVNEIIKKLQLNCSEKELRTYLKNNNEIESIKKKKIVYRIKQTALL